MARFIRFPWATTGDRTPVPFDTDPGGAVSYAQGFGPDYEIAPGDPGWKPVPRDETNGLYYDLTENIRQYQLNGTPDWHPAVDNDGVAISYPLNAIVRWNDLVYRSVVANNTVEPGTDPTKWVVDSVAGLATEAQYGLVRFATIAEAAARVVTDKAVTPAGLGALFNLLLNQPIFPEVLGDTGLFDVSSPAGGTIRIAAGTQWTHRGAFLYTSAQTDLATVANKTYHLRWDRTNGFALYDLSSGSYNPSAVAETDPTFDTTYDSMLVARVVTSAGNVATITPLSNKARLLFNGAMTAGGVISPGQSGSLCTQNVTYNWSRTPAQKSFTRVRLDVSPSGTDDRDEGVLTGSPLAQVFDIPATRYASSFTYKVDGMTAGFPARLVLSIGA